MFQIPNTPGVKRLHIGVIGAGGAYAEINFTAQDKHSPLVADMPTELEVNEMYLCATGWTRNFIEGIGAVWSDPETGGDYPFETAVQMQEQRDALGPQEPPQDHRIFNRRQPDGTFRPLSDFFLNVSK